MRKLSYYLWFLPLGLLILYGCGKLERKGTPHSNVPPTVYLADIPTEGTHFSVNPRIYWFGTDVDGYITAYQYAVMETVDVMSAGGLAQVKSFLHGIPSDSASWVDQTSIKNIIGVHVLAEPGGSSRNVMMFADMNPHIYTPQYIFVRAVDNDGAVSDSLVYRMFYRNNHRPEAIMDVDNVFKITNHYCLMETTATWKGISISWHGLDTLDYPDVNNQPDFSYKWELVGPFGSSPTPSTVDTNKIVAMSLDSLLVAGEWHTFRWVSENSHVFWGLKNFGEDVGADSGFGWYQLRVRARDDAFVSTDTATTLNFRIVKPKFRYTDRDKRTILVVDATKYSSQTGPTGAGGALDPNKIRLFYGEAFNSLLTSGWCDDFVIWCDSTSSSTGSEKKAPGEDILSRYDLTVVLNLGYSPDINKANFDSYRAYLDIGGRLWFIGLNNFNLGSGRDKPHEMAELRFTSPNTYEVGVEYFGIEEVFVPSYTKLDSTTLEFIQAKPFGLWKSLPTLLVDTTKCKELKGYNPDSSVVNYGVRGIPYVCYDGLSNDLDYHNRNPYQRRIYDFISYYGSASLMQNHSCAINYIGPTYRTTEFTFPLNLMKNEASDGYPVFKVIEDIVKWFWEDLP